MAFFAPPRYITASKSKDPAARLSRPVSPSGRRKLPHCSALNFRCEWGRYGDGGDDDDADGDVSLLVRGVWPDREGTAAVASPPTGVGMDWPCAGSVLYAHRQWYAAVRSHSSPNISSILRVGLFGLFRLFILGLFWGAESIRVRRVKVYGHNHHSLV